MDRAEPELTPHRVQATPGQVGPGPGTPHCPRAESKPTARGTLRRQVILKYLLAFILLQEGKLAVAAPRGRAGTTSERDQQAQTPGGSRAEGCCCRAPPGAKLLQAAGQDALGKDS